MKIHRYSTVVVLLIAFWVNGTPAWGVSKEMVQLQTQVQGLQDQMTQMQTSFNEKMGVMQHLMDQNTDSMNKVAASITAVQTSLEKLQTDNGGKVGQLSGQIQALNDSIDELKAQQTQQQALAQAPPPDVLYNNALRDYNAAKNDLAKQEFSDYVKFYPNTDLAGNAYFYLAELAYKQGNFQEAVTNYDQVLQNFPTGNKAPSSDLKKGLALIELGKTDDGIAQLRHVIQRYPRSNEALQARDRLRKLGVSTTATRAPGE